MLQPTEAGPRLLTTVDLPIADTWYLWVRNKGITGSALGWSDSVHFEADGRVLNTIYDIQATTTWSNTGSGWQVATVSLPAGEQSIGLKMREDGVSCYEFAISTDANWIPQANQRLATTSTGSNANSSPQVTPQLIRSDLAGAGLVVDAVAF